MQTSRKFKTYLDSGFKRHPQILCDASLHEMELHSPPRECRLALVTHSNKSTTAELTVCDFGHKIRKDIVASSLLSLSQVTHSRESQLPCYKDTQEFYKVHMTRNVGFRPTIGTNLTDM